MHIYIDNALGENAHQWTILVKLLTARIRFGNNHNSLVLIVSLCLLFFSQKLFPLNTCGE
jgi:hypothetical protein